MKENTEGKETKKDKKGNDLYYATLLGAIITIVAFMVKYL